MNPIQVILIGLVLQVSLSILFDKLLWKNVKHVIFVIILALYFFVLPAYFIPGNPTNEPMCGMPAMAICFAFWFLGGGTTFLTHLIYLLIVNNKRRIPK